MSRSESGVLRDEIARMSGEVSELKAVKARMTQRLE